MIPVPVGFQCPHCAGGIEPGRARTPTLAVGPARSSPYVTWTIMGLCVLAFLWSSAGGLSPAVGQFGLIPAGVADGEYWRLLTSPFLHAGIMHLGFNMLVLYMLGPTLEMVFGHMWFLVLYLMSALGGATLSYLFLDPFGASVGASGAIFGLMGALIVAGRRLQYDVKQVVILLLINLAISFILGSFIDWRAHLGGLVVGSLVAVLFAHGPRRRPVLYRVVGCVAILAVLVGTVGWRTGQLSGPAGSPAVSQGSAGRQAAVDGQVS